MPTSLAVLYVFGGAVYLVMGGDLLVRGAVALSRRVGVSPMAVGLTVVALGTSAPELVVSVRAALAGFPDLAIANVVGSNIANALLVVGLPALVYPLACDQKGVGRQGLLMLGVSVLFFALCFAGPLGRLDGALLLGGMVLFGVYVARSSASRDAWIGEPEVPLILGLPSSPVMIGLFISLGILALPLGAELLIRGAVTLAEALEVPNAVVGLTMVALGTSLPELATTTVAALKGDSDVAVGNVLGSNVLNLLLIMGAAALVSPAPIRVPEGFLVLDLPVMLGSGALLTAVALRRRTVGRGLGGLLAGAYVLYAFFLFQGAG